MAIIHVPHPKQFTSNVPMKEMNNVAAKSVFAVGKNGFRGVGRGSATYYVYKRPAPSSNTKWPRKTSSNTRDHANDKTRLQKPRSDLLEFESFEETILTKSVSSLTPVRLVSDGT